MVLIFFCLVEVLRSQVRNLFFVAAISMDPCEIKEHQISQQVCLPFLCLPLSCLFYHKVSCELSSWSTSKMQRSNNFFFFSPVKTVVTHIYIYIHFHSRLSGIHRNPIRFPNVMLDRARPAARGTECVFFF